MRDIKVNVLAISDKKCWQLQWRDPDTGRIRTKSSGITREGRKKDRGQAERVAAILQAELEAGANPLAGKMPWDQFAERYRNEHARGLAAESRAKIEVVFNIVERVVHPRVVGDVDDRRLADIVSVLRNEGKSESTIHSYLSHLKAVLRWGLQRKLIAEMPAIPKIQRRRKSGSNSLMKGRPITKEEFERMLEATCVVVGDAWEAWQFYLRGLWSGGLRLSESLQLWWDRTDKLHPVFSDGELPMLRIIGRYEKSNTDRLLPMAPEFAQLLTSVPAELRTGRVFKLPGQRNLDSAVGKDWVGKRVSEIGRQAGVFVDDAGRKPASAQDLRRTFGARWAALLMPPRLRELMRHSSIETTMRYYVGENAKETARACWDAWDQSSGSVG